MAAKASCPRSPVECVARPSLSTAPLPAVPAYACSSPVERPMKRLRPLPSTAERIQRITAPTPSKAAPPKPSRSSPAAALPTNRTLEDQFDAVSRQRHSPKPDSSLVFPEGEEEMAQAGFGVVFTPTAAPTEPGSPKSIVHGEPLEGIRRDPFLQEGVDRMKTVCFLFQARGT